MATLIVQMVDKTHPDPVMDCRQYKAGDVITVLPDSVRLSDYVLTHPSWRVIELPGVDETEARTLLAEEPDDGSGNEMRRRRAFRLDFSRWSARVQASIGDKTTTRAILPTVAVADLRRARVRKAALVSNPKVIG